MTRLLPLLLLIALNGVNTAAVILYGTGDPSSNTSAPSGALTNSGWQYAGAWGQFTGWPISTNYFIVAKHVGGSVGQALGFHGIDYTTIASYPDSSSDLTLWKVATPFSFWSPIYTNNDETGKTLVMIGRGTQRGSTITVNCSGTNFDVGWFWGSSDGVMRWGTNTIFLVSNGYSISQFSSAGADTCSASSGDSSGGMFINDGSQWALDAVISAVSQQSVAVHTFHCLYGQTATYGTRLQPRIGWINAIISGTPYTNQTLISATVSGARLSGCRIGGH